MICFPWFPPIMFLGLFCIRCGCFHYVILLFLKMANEGLGMVSNMFLECWNFQNVRQLWTLEPLSYHRNTLKHTQGWKCVWNIVFANIGFYNFQSFKNVCSNMLNIQTLNMDNWYEKRHTTRNMECLSENKKQICPTNTKQLLKNNWTKTNAVACHCHAPCPKSSGLAYLTNQSFR